MRVIAIIPAYNEASRIAEAVRDALQFVQVAVVVDDCSKDATGAVAKQAGAIVLRHVINRGQGAALQTGTEYALRYLAPDAIVHFDADGQMRGSEIPGLLQCLQESGAHVVLGSRFLGRRAEEMPWYRSVTLFVGRIFTALVSGLWLTDTHNGFRVLSATGAQQIRITLDRMAHASEILDTIRTKRLIYAEYPVTIRYNQATLQKGQSFFGGVIVVKDFFKKRFLS